MKRRQFLRNSAATAASVGLLSSARGASPNEKITVGIMGVGGRGRRLLASLVKRSDVEIKYICDADTRAFGPAAEIVIEGHGKRPEFVQDFREMLDDKELDAVVNATSDRWHALGTIMACQAGKDVYVEKPLSLSIWDGRKMVEAARKYERVVQVGTQSRSAPYLRSAIDYIRSGKLGDVYLARVFFMQYSGPIKVEAEQPVPEELDYELWCGPAPKLPYRPGRWFWRHWDFYTGWITADMIHQLDLARALIGRDYPQTVSHAGGVFFHDDGREQPDTQFVTYEYGDKLTMLVEASLHAPYMHRIVHLPEDRTFPDWPFSATKVEICGTKGIMFIGRHGGGWQVFEGDTKTRESRPVASTPAKIKFGSIVDLHFDDFFNCIRTRETPAADVEQGHLSMINCHLGAISYRLGNRKLRFDPKTEQFIGDEEANKLLRATCREPWTIPEEV